MAKRVFISGVGVVSPVGNDRNQFWASLREGRSGIGPLEIVDTTNLPVTIGGEVRGFDPSLADVNEAVSSRKMDRATIFAVLAAREAIADSGLDVKAVGDRAAVVIGSGLAGLQTLQEQTENLIHKGPRSV